MSVEIQMFTAIVVPPPVHQRIDLLVTLLTTVEPFEPFASLYLYPYILMSGTHSTMTQDKLRLVARRVTDLKLVYLN